MCLYSAQIKPLLDFHTPCLLPFFCIVKLCVYVGYVNVNVDVDVFVLKQKPYYKNDTLSNRRFCISKSIDLLNKNVDVCECCIGFGGEYFFGSLVSLNNIGTASFT